MAKADDDDKEAGTGYNAATKLSSFNFFFSILLLLLYEGSVRLMRATGGGQVINGVDALFEMVLLRIPFGTWLVSGVVVVAGLAIYLADRKQGVKIKSSYYIYGFLESLAWATAIYFLLPQLLSHVFTNSLVLGQSQALPRPGMLENIGLSFGAGFYEELFFRFLLVRGLLLTLSLFGVDRHSGGALFGVIVVSALLFSAAHYIPPLGDQFTLPSFIFRAVFGLIMSFLLVFRRFAITAWSHALYDILVYVTRFITGH